MKKVTSADKPAKKVLNLKLKFVTDSDFSKINLSGLVFGLRSAAKKKIKKIYMSIDYYNCRKEFVDQFLLKNFKVDDLKVFFFTKEAFEKTKIFEARKHKVHVISSQI